MDEIDTKTVVIMGLFSIVILLFIFLCSCSSLLGASVAFNSDDDQDDQETTTSNKIPLPAISGMPSNISDKYFITTTSSSALMPVFDKQGNYKLVYVEGQNESSGTPKFFYLLYNPGNRKLYRSYLSHTECPSLNATCTGATASDNLLFTEYAQLF